MGTLHAVDTGHLMNENDSSEFCVKVIYIIVPSPLMGEGKGGGGIIKEQINSFIHNLRKRDPDAEKVIMATFKVTLP